MKAPVKPEATGLLNHLMVQRVSGSYEHNERKRMKKETGLRGQAVLTDWTSVVGETWRFNPQTRPVWDCHRTAEFLGQGC